MSTTWKVGVREVSRPYLCVSTSDPGHCYIFTTSCMKLSSGMATYRCSTELVFPERSIAHPAYEDDGGWL